MVWEEGSREAPPYLDDRTGGMRILKNLALSVAGLVVSFFLCEIIVRWTDLDHRRLGDPFRSSASGLLHYLIPDPYLQWRGRPGAALQRPMEVLNDRGLRTPELPRKKGPGARRVAVLGDSCTFGILVVSHGVLEMPRPYAALLQDLLDRNWGPGKVEVINYGVLGYSSYHGLRMMRREALPDDPDFVVIRFGWNDHLGSPVLRAFSNPRHVWEETLLDWAYRSRLIGLLLYRGLPLKNRDQVPLTTSSHPIPWVTEGDYAWNLSRMIDLARDRGAEPILVDAPAGPITPELRDDRLFLSWAGYLSMDQIVAAHARYQAITERVAAEKKVTLIRTADRIGNDVAYFSNSDLVHPNAEGQAVIAQRLFLRIVESLARAGAGGTP